MDRITDAFLWPFKDPQWASKIMLIALISVIPVIGLMNGLGWMIGSLRNLRSGDERLAPADFSHLGIGARLFLVQLLYGLAVAVVAAVAYVPAGLLAAATSNGSSNAGLIVLALLLYLVGFGAATLGSLAVLFMTPAIVLAVDSGGIGGGLNVPAVLRQTRLSISNTLIAGLMLIAASFISSIGVVACFVGIFVTGAYAYAMQAWIIRSFEVG